MHKVITCNRVGVEKTLNIVCKKNNTGVYLLDDLTVLILVRNSTLSKVWIHSLKIGFGHTVGGNTPHDF